MAKTDFQSFEDYAATFSDEVQGVLRQVRGAILAGMPGDPEEVISYQIPAVKFHGFVFYFSAFATHFSLSQPPPFAAFGEFADELSGYKRSKSAVRFPYSQGVPTDLITRMSRFQAELNRGASAR